MDKNLSNKYTNIDIFDTPDDLDEIYKLGSIFANPMLHGAGVKLKTINAIVNGLPVVSTTIGNQGTGLKNGKHIYVSDDIYQYANMIRILIENKEKRLELIKNGQEFIKVHYNQEIILYKYFSNL